MTATKTKGMPRGIRNNNPGNIDFNPKTKWQGLVMDLERTDSRFCQFKDATWGIRAMARVLITYQDKYGLNTVRGIINRWAPPNENSTAGYVAAVCNATSFHADEPLDLQRYEALCPLVEAIIRHENGIGPKANANTWYDRSLIDPGLRLAGVVKPVRAVAAMPMTKETVAASTTGTLGVAQIADVAPHVMTAISSQQEELNSGQIMRVVLAVLMIGLAVTIAYSQVKKHQAGTVQ